MGKVFTSLSIFFSTLASVVRARLANKQGNNAWIPLPPVSPTVNQHYSKQQLVGMVDPIVRRLIFNTAHPCLYYAYARCRVLRNNGYAVQLNIGMHNLQSGLQPEGHCWLSYEGKVLFEEQDPHRMYPDRLGEKEDVVYWLPERGRKDKTFLRQVKQE